MGSVNIDQILITPLKRIHVVGGDVLHGMKYSDPGYAGFSEAYFSIIEAGAIKAWKRHVQMTLNLVVPLGEVLFVFIDDEGRTRKELVGVNRYVRLTVPPSIWFGFKGLLSPTSMIMNVANIRHDQSEIQRKQLSELKYDWTLK